MCNMVRAKQQDWTTTSLIIESVNKALWMNGPSSTALIGWLRGVKLRLNVFAVYTNMKLEIWSILKVRNASELENLKWLCVCFFQLTVLFLLRRKQILIIYIFILFYIFCIIFLFVCKAWYIINIISM